MREHFDLQQLFLRERSFSHFSDADVLDTLLSVAGVRGDTEGMVQTMLDACGCYKNVLEARPDFLERLPGVSGKAALIVSMIPALAGFWERVNSDSGEYIRNTREAMAFCKSLLSGRRNENFYVICLSCRCRVLGHRLISQGTLCEVSAYPRSVLESALNYNAHSVILCHNHPGGTNSPSTEDITSTIQLQRLLKAVGIMTLDHIIVAGADCYSMSQHGDVDFLR